MKWWCKVLILVMVVMFYGCKEKTLQESPKLTINGAGASFPYIL